MSRRIHIVGRKNSGKTMLIAELFSHLTMLGYRVGTIKHTHHHHELDTPGKDSFRHREAGANVAGIMTPQMTAVFQPTAESDKNADRYSAIMAMFDQCDLVLVEGDFQTDAPKIEVWRAATKNEPLAAKDTSIVSVFTDDPLEVQATVLRWADVAGLADWILWIVKTAPVRMPNDNGLVALRTPDQSVCNSARLHQNIPVVSRLK